MESRKPNKTIERSQYSEVALGDRAPVILDSSDDPDTVSVTQSQAGSHHQLQYQDIQRQTGRKLHSSQSLTNKFRSSAANKRTSISLTSIALATSYHTMVQKLPAHTAEGLIRTIFQDRAPEQENIKLVFINELYLVQSIIKVTEADAGTVGNKRLVRHWKLMNRTLMFYLKLHHQLIQILDESREEE